MPDDIKTAKTALAKPHHDMEAINRLAKPSYLSVIAEVRRQTAFSAIFAMPDSIESMR